MASTHRWFPPRVVDASLLAAVVVLLATGVAGLVAGRPGQWWVVAAHGVSGLAVLPLLAAKLYRVRGRLRSPSRSVAISALLAVTTVAALATGLAWTLGVGIRVGPFPPLVVHGLFGLAVSGLLVVHLRRRFRLPGRDDLDDRRTALRFVALVTASTVAWRAQGAGNRLRNVAPRRFTGSREAGSDAGNAFPVTSWVADDPAPVDPSAWSLRVDGLVETPREFGYGDVVPAPGLESAGEGSGDHRAGDRVVPRRGDDDRGDVARALLDCTSGWYSTHDWRGVRGGTLLDAAGPEADARWVTFHSITGYRWSLPIEEARSALLATHVDGERLSHGHGFPVRLVAPGRRGFQWVKWIDRVEVRRRRDLGELVAIFASGFR